MRFRWGKGVAAVLGVTAALAPAAFVPMSAPARDLYVTHGGNLSNEGGGIRTMSIGADGTLGGGPTLATGESGLFAAAISPDGRRLYVAGWTFSFFGALGVNPDGSLGEEHLSPSLSVFSPEGVSITPDGRFGYVTNSEPGTVSMFDLSGAAPVAIAPAAPAGGKPHGIATTPDGRHVYVTNRATNNVSAFAVGANGALTKIADFPMPAGPPAALGPSGIVISPDGRFLFTANISSSSVSAFSVDPSGLLTPVGTFKSSEETLDGLALSPDGRHLFAASDFNGRVAAFNVAADGSLAQVGTGVSTGGLASGYPGMAVTPDGKYLYATGEGNLGAGEVAAFTIQPNGALVGVLGSPFPTGLISPEFQSLAIVPDQSPVASFTARPGKGTKVSFDGSASSDSDGSVARYDWDFGDGQSLADGAPKPTHAYARPGKYTVKLAVTDNEGCSSPLVYTGQTASCTGAPAATQAVRAGRFAVALAGARKQPLSKKGIALTAKCNVVPCKVTASAAIKSLKLKTGKVSARSRRAGQRLKLRLPFSPALYAALRRAVSRSGTLKAVVKAGARAAGSKASAKRTVTLTG